MKSTRIKWTVTLVCICLIAVWSVGQIACSDDDRSSDDNNNDNNSGDSDSDSDSDTDGDTDTDTDGDTDTDSDTDEECVVPAWGSGFTTGQPTANWNITAIFDQDGDGVIADAELTPTPTTLEEIHCVHGKNSLVMYLHDRD